MIAWLARSLFQSTVTFTAHFAITCITTTIQYATLRHNLLTISPQHPPDFSSIVLVFRPAINPQALRLSAWPLILSPISVYFILVSLFLSLSSFPSLHLSIIDGLKTTDLEEAILPQSETDTALEGAGK